MTDFDDPVAVEHDEPDLEAIYLPHVDGGGWQMTPRMAWYLWTAALYLADEWRAARAEAPARVLPPVAHPYAPDRTWRRQFVAGFARIAERLAAVDDDGETLTRRTAEDVARGSPSTSPSAT